MSKCWTIAVLVGSLFLSACVSIKVPMEVVPDNRRVTQPERGKALVYFVRTTTYNKDVPADLYDGDHYIGTIVYGQHIAYSVKPGSHLFMVTNKLIESVEFMEARLKSGKVYYAAVAPHVAWEGGAFGKMVARLHFNPQNNNLSQKDIDQAIHKSRQVKIGEKARRHAAKQAKRVRKKKAKFLPRWEKSAEHKKRILRAY